MQYETEQLNFWKGDFGKEYTDRSTHTDLNSWNDWYKNLYGHSRLEMFDEFINHLDFDCKILEVGCNTGMQLRGLQKMGFRNLYGIEIQDYAVEKSKSLSQGINIIQGSGFDVPFKDEYFDLVMTNGVLIHIHPDDLLKILGEIYRCSKKYILGYEYFEEDTKEINYRGNQGYLWKSNFSSIYLREFPNLKLVKEIKYPYLLPSEAGNIDSMFLLEKK